MRSHLDRLFSEWKLGTHELQEPGGAEKRSQKALGAEDGGAHAGAEEHRGVYAPQAPGGAGGAIAPNINSKMSLNIAYKR